MFRRPVFIALLVALVPMGRASGTATATNGCDGFSRDLTRELAVMRTAATPVAAAANAGNSRAGVVPDRHYTVTLRPQSEVRFDLPPARPARDAMPQGGTLEFVVDTAGRYRVSIISAHWIDVVADGRFIDSVAHEGHRECALLRKSVEFDLPARTRLVLQISGRAERELGLAITRARPVRPWRG